MTAISAPFRHATRSSLDAWRNAALVSAGLAAVTVARWAATRAGLDALAVGAVFGLALLLLAAPGAGDRALATRVTRIDLGQLSRAVVIGVVLFTLFAQGTTAELVVTRTGSRALAPDADLGPGRA